MVQSPDTNLETRRKERVQITDQIELSEPRIAQSTVTHLCSLTVTAMQSLGPWSMPVGRGLAVKFWSIEGTLDSDITELYTENLQSQR